MTRAIRLYLPLLLVLICSACSKTTLLRHRQDYTSNYTQYHQLLVMPVVAEIHIADFSDKKERLYDYEYHIQDLITRQIIPILEAKGFKTKLLSKSDIKELQLGKDITSFKSKYNQLRQELYKPLLLEEAKAFAIDKSVGQFSADLGKKTQSDLLVVVDYAGLIKTNGARVRDLAMSLLFNNRTMAENADNAVMFIGMVEAKSGNILWLNNHTMREDIYTSAWNNMKAQDKVELKKINEIINTALQPFKAKHN